jgi:hypothetical protein
VAGVIGTSLNSLQGFYGEGGYRGLRPGPSSPVIERVADHPGPKKQSNISNEEENSMAERSVNKAIAFVNLIWPTLML